MKKAIIASAIAMTMGSGSAMAAQSGDIQFTGNVSAVTCDLAPVVNGTSTNMVQLGTVAPSATKGVEMPFSLKVVNAADAACAALTATQTATIAWTGSFNNEGLTNQSGKATGAVLLLKTANAKTTQVQAMTSSTNFAEFEANKVIDGFKFTAELKGGSTPGNFASTASYAVTYQ